MSPASSFWLKLAMQGGLLLAVAGDAVGAETGSAGPAHSWKTPAGWKMLGVDAYAIPAGIEYSEVRLMAGDDPRWAEPGYADDAWKVLTFGRDMPVRTGMFWLRFWIRLPALSPPLRIRLVVNGAYDLYWDGRWIGNSGRPGKSREEEIPGPLGNGFDLPATALAPGEHAVALRLSSHRFLYPESTAKFIVQLAAPGDYENANLKYATGPAMAFGSLLMLALASLIVWPFAGRRRSWLFLAGLCLSAALSQAMIAQLSPGKLPYHWQYLRELGITISIGIFGVLLVATVVDQFQLSRGRWLVGAFLVLATAAIVMERAVLSPIQQFIMVLSFATALGGTLQVIRRGRWDAGPAATGLAISLGGVAWVLFLGDGNVLGAFFKIFLPTVLGFAAALGWRWRDQRRQSERAKLTAARLEIELLRKQLQPHFLMNTLTVLAQAIEENPGGATRLIEDLSIEARSLTRMAGEKLVPLAQELKLCRAHLRVMSVRTEKPWQLEAEGCDPVALVPPALFLTLIENGFSHQRPAAGVSSFTLRSNTAGSATCYRFFSPGEVPPDAGRDPGGTGLRYVKARLEESFPGGWSFTQGAVPGGWETVIELRPRAGREVGA